MYSCLISLRFTDFITELAIFTRRRPQSSSQPVEQLRFCLFFSYSYLFINCKLSSSHFRSEKIAIHFDIILKHFCVYSIKLSILLSIPVINLSFVFMARSNCSCVISPFNNASLSSSISSTTIIPSG